MKALSISQLRQGAAVAVSGLLLVAACTYKNKTGDIPAPTCSVPATVSFQTNVWPILKSNCRDACHNSQSYQAYAGFNMDNFSEIQHYATTPPNYGGLTVPYLLGNIQHLPNYVNMPVGAAKLSDCDINIIAAWVNAGAPNN